QLAFDDDRVDHGAEVVDGGVFHYLDHAGRGIDLNLADVTAIGKRRGARSVAHVLHVERGGDAVRQVDARAQLGGEVHDADRRIGARNHKAAVHELDVGSGRLEHMRGDLLAALDHLGAGFDQRGASVHEALRAARAAAHDQPVAVALDEPDLVERDAELLMQDLRKRGGVTHAEVERAAQDRDAAVGFEYDAAELLRGRRGGLEIAADAEPAQLAVLTALALALGEAFDV